MAHVIFFIIQLVVTLYYRKIIPLLSCRLNVVHGDISEHPSAVGDVSTSRCSGRHDGGRQQDCFAPRNDDMCRNQQCLHKPSPFLEGARGRKNITHFQIYEKIFFVDRIETEFNV